MTLRTPRQPVPVDAVLDDPDIVHDIVRQQSPHPMTLAGPEYAQSRAGMEAAAKRGECPPWATIDEARQRPLIPGLFRTTWATQNEHVEGADGLLHNERLAEAARQLYDAAIVKPYFVYANVSTPNPPMGTHTDITAFRGIERDQHPTWLLNVMAYSGLFERWRVKIATAVSWYYSGLGGGFTYWPQGWDGPATRLQPPVNSCVVGDNDFMPHRVERIGEDRQTMYPMDATISLEPDGRWQVREHDTLIDEFDFEEVRVSVSWKATVFTDAQEARAYEEHLDDIDIATVLEKLRSDCATRGIELPGDDRAAPADLLDDPAFATALRAAYLRPEQQY